MAPSTFSLSALSDDERNSLLVLAVAGDWSLADELEQLEHLTTARGFAPMRRPDNIWGIQLEQWAEIGLLQRRGGVYYVPSYLLHRALAHEVLSTVEPIMLKRLQDALGKREWQDAACSRQLARVSLYLGDTARFLGIMAHSGGEDWILLFGGNPQPEVFALVPDVVKEQYLAHLAENALELGTPMPWVIWNSTAQDLDAHRIAARALRGEIALDSDLLVGLAPESDSSGRTHAALALVNLSNGGVRQAQAHGARALALSAGSDHDPTLRGPLGDWAALCALTGTPEECAMGELFVHGTNNRRTYDASAREQLLESFVSWRNDGAESPLAESVQDAFRDDWAPLTWLFRQLLVRWTVMQKLELSAVDEGEEDEAAAIATALSEHGYLWGHSQYVALLEVKGMASKCTLASMYTPKAAWERRLDRLSGLATSLDRNALRKRTGEVQRLIWILDAGRTRPSARLQRQTTKGFTKGRKITASTLVDLKDQSWVEDRDRAVIATVHRFRPRAYQEDFEYALGPEAVLALGGHPRVYWEESLEPAEVVHEAPSIRVIRNDESIVLAPIPWRQEEGVWSERRGSKVVVALVDAQHVKLCETIGAAEVRLPANAETRLATILGRLSKNIPLQSDVVPEGATVREVEADPKLVLKLRRDGDKLRIRLTVRPLGEFGPQFEAGRGSVVVVADIEGVPTQTCRDRSCEASREAELLRACPSLLHADIRDNDYTLVGLGSCLELVQELHALGDEVVCMWSEGEPLNVDLSADLEGLRFRFGDTDSWLSADIEVQVSEELTLKAHELVSRMVAGSTKFVRLDDGRFIALSDELSRKIEGLPQLGKIGKKGIALAPANAYALSAWLSDLEEHKGGGGAKLATERLAKVRESATIEVPLPSTFEAELRPYQLEAFEWLQRLAHWGGGALLCDDMGLGKTVQMLAVLVARGNEGPALVVAPVSVCPHWVNLMRRFAPTLTPREFELGDRAKTLASLGPRDVLLVSYGLLHSEEELMTGRSFRTIVLDEAQAIKNPRSQRARVAHQLRGDLRVVTTGTPIENHLGELWSIMNFANPGLLGTGREFAEKFGKPIQRDGDRQASTRLRRILRPFLLRRTKGQVLDELPPKTEITIEVEPSQEESEYYAAIRDAMLVEIQAGLNRPTQQRMQVLAALMKLRRIACHPRLADEGISVGSAKQTMFMELVTELREAGHRILVFSQFVGHLAIARDSLDHEKIPYQYLDGQTSRARRKLAVDAFQGGEGDVFLISLKAGGVGLDLTGADYVIHLDPWWNPAVEDQASDRAHRIGQTRPVTVYRLVTKGTVEERVLELHGRKRQLAEDLISGNESASPLGVGELMDLMRS
ncbi:MAG: DEAD/DEAH box helicase [Myxococcales bacterium]|nr:DEAD/DEAH box helicase [Myxococcales bacterium]